MKTVPTTTSDPDEGRDEELVAFLRRHRPVAPDAAEGLEARVLEACEPRHENHAVPMVAHEKRRGSQLARLLAGTGVAAALAAGVLLWTHESSQVALPEIQGVEMVSQNDEDQLEEFMVASWEGAVLSPEEDFMAVEWMNE